MNKPTKSLLLAALVALAPAAYAQAQVLTNGMPETDPALFANGVFNTNDPANDNTVTSNGGAPFGDTTGANLSQINVGNGERLINSFQNQEIHSTEVNINSGGDTANSLHFFNSEVNVLAGGEIGSSFTVEANSTLNAAAGSTIGSNGTVLGTVNINGATVQGNFNTSAGSTLNIGPGSDLTSSSSLNNFDGTVNISGGEIGSSTDFNSNSNVTISGGNFGGNIDFNGAVTFSGGTFGSNFNINSTATGVVFDVTDGGVIIDAFTPEFFADVIINGGDFGGSAEFEAGTTSVINDGSFGNNVEALGELLTINGGTFGTNFDVGTSTVPSTLIVNGGTIDFLDIDGGSTVFLNGGDTSNNIDVREDGTLNITGGDFTTGILAAEGDVDLFGSAFFIDGVAITGSDVFAVEGSVLTGILNDGSSVELDLFLNGVVVDFFQTRDFFAGGLTAGGTNITIVAVPEPGSLSILTLGALGLISRRRRS